MNITFKLLIIIFVFGFFGCDDKKPQPNNQTSKQKDLPVPEVKMVKVPAGVFIRGSNKEDKEGMQQEYGFPNPLYLDERPESKIDVDEFFIDIYEVTNIQFKAFILSTNRMMPFAWVNTHFS